MQCLRHLSVISLSALHAIQVHGAELQAGCVEKSLWASIFWLLSAGLGGITVGEVVTHHKQAVKDLAHELLPLAVSMLSHEMQASQFPGV